MRGCVVGQVRIRFNAGNVCSGPDRSRVAGQHGEASRGRLTISGKSADRTADVCTLARAHRCARVRRQAHDCAVRYRGRERGAGGVERAGIADVHRVRNVGAGASRIRRAQGDSQIGTGGKLLAEDRDASDALRKHPGNCGRAKFSGVATSVHHSAGLDVDAVEPSRELVVCPEALAVRIEIQVLEDRFTAGNCVGLKDIAVLINSHHAVGIGNKQGFVGQLAKRKRAMERCNYVRMLHLLAKVVLLNG